MSVAVSVAALRMAGAPIPTDRQPPGPPAAFLATLPGHGLGKPLLIGYCAVGSHLCLERTALAWGDVCGSPPADSIGDGESGDVVGGRPWPLRYAGWRCGVDGGWHDRSERVPAWNWAD